MASSVDPYVARSAPTPQPHVDAARFVTPGTGLSVAVSSSVAAISLIVSSLLFFGLPILLLLIGVIVDWFRSRWIRAGIRSSAIHVGPQQFPQLYQSMVRQAGRLGLRELPELYIVEDNTQNAAALKARRHKLVLLTDDIVYGALRTKNEAVIDFIIGHELAHVALGHTNAIRGWLRTVNKKLSRLDEYSCDAVAMQLTSDPKAAADALLLLTSGPQLFSVVNREEFGRQAIECADDKLARKAERSSTHPLLLRRFARVIGYQFKL